MLSQSVALYVPSSDRRGNPVDPDNRDSVLDFAQRAMAGRFGGFTQSQGIGGWIGSAGLIRERIDVLRSWVASCDPADLRFLETLALHVALTLDQESVSIETPQGLGFVSAPVPSVPAVA